MDFAFMLAAAWLASLFLYSAGLKLAHYETSGAAVRVYGIFPSAVASAIGFALPWFEVGAATLLLVPGLVAYGALLSGLLGATFSYGAHRVLRDNEAVDCGCAGPWRREPVGRATVARGVLICAVGIAVFLGALGGLMQGVSPPIGAAIAVVSLLPGTLEVRGRVRRSLARRSHERAVQEETQRLMNLLSEAAERDSGLPAVEGALHR